MQLASKKAFKKAFQKLHTSNDYRTHKSAENWAEISAFLSHSINVCIIDGSKLSLLSPFIHAKLEYDTILLKLLDMEWQFFPTKNVLKWNENDEKHLSSKYFILYSLSLYSKIKYLHTRTDELWKIAVFILQHQNRRLCLFFQMEVNKSKKSMRVQRVKKRPWWLMSSDKFCYPSSGMEMITLSMAFGTS